MTSMLYGWLVVSDVTTSEYDVTRRCRDLALEPRDCVPSPSVLKITCCLCVNDERCDVKSQVKLNVQSVYLVVRKTVKMGQSKIGVETS